MHQNKTRKRPVLSRTHMSKILHELWRVHGKGQTLRLQGPVLWKGVRLLRASFGSAGRLEAGPEIYLAARPWHQRTLGLEGSEVVG